MRPHDTSPKAFAAYIEILRGMTPSQRLEVGLQLGDAQTEVMAAGVRMRHPHYDDDAVNEAIVLLRLGADNFAKMHPGKALPVP